MTGGRPPSANSNGLYSVFGYQENKKKQRNISHTLKTCTVSDFCGFIRFKMLFKFDQPNLAALPDHNAVTSDYIRLGIFQINCISLDYFRFQLGCKQVSRQFVNNLHARFTLNRDTLAPNFPG